MLTVVEKTEVALVPATEPLEPRVKEPKLPS